ncbi:restriction endonuclease subunit S [Phocaeicola sp.]|jgi:type I restriction enzyme S subunit|uniref:restriction endonuclease subunit S n=1 Tax=Phocaeicola sp. TaxID=2773926 RepID=UPI003A90A413
MSTVKLGDVARESRLKWERSKLDVPIVGLEHLIPGEIRFEAYDKNIDNTFSKKFVKGQVLFGRRRSYQRKAAVAEFDGICSGDITVIETIGGKMVSELLPFIIQTPAFFDYANKGSAGSLSPRVKWEHLADYEFELPSLKEQKVLADKLWAAYRLKEGYKKLYVATDEMVKSQFIEMFGNPLSSKQENELKKLGECCILNPRRPNIALCDTDKVSFVPMSAVSEDGYLIDMIDEEYGKVKKGFTYFENNDVLFAKITPCMENGKGAIAHGLTNGVGMGSTEFHVLRPIEGISSSYWLLALTRMPIFRERAAKNMSGTGGQKRVGASYLEHFMIGLPTIEEQRHFEAMYKQADKSKFELERCIENIDKVIKSLINS